MAGDLTRHASALACNDDAVLVAILACVPTDACYIRSCSWSVAY